MFVELIVERSIASLNVTVGRIEAAMPTAPSAGTAEATRGLPESNTVKRPEDVPKTPSAFVTSTVVPPSGVVPGIVTFARSRLHDVNVTELTAMPVAPSATPALLAKFVAVIVRSSVPPLAAEEGLTDVSTGRGRPETSFE